MHDCCAVLGIWLFPQTELVANVYAYWNYIGSRLNLAPSSLENQNPQVRGCIWRAFEAMCCSLQLRCADSLLSSEHYGMHKGILPWWVSAKSDTNLDAWSCDSKYMPMSLIAQVVLTEKVTCIGPARDVPQYGIYLRLFHNSLPGVSRSASRVRWKWPNDYSFQKSLNNYMTYQ